MGQIIVSHIKNIIHCFIKIIYILFFNLVIIKPAYAYIDPNAGGFFFQTIAPIIYGVLGIIVVFWKRITGFIRGIINRLKKRDE